MSNIGKVRAIELFIGDVLVTMRNNQQLGGKARERLIQAYDYTYTLGEQNDVTKRCMYNFGYNDAIRFNGDS